MATSKSAALLNELDNHLRKTYGTITVKGGDVVDYVGMTFDFTKQGTVKVTMLHCAQDILSGYGVKGTAATPATEHLFDIRETTKTTAEEAKWFHTYVAKILYKWKRVKP